MDFLEESQRNFVFSCYPNLKFIKEGVRAESGTVRFSKEVFKDQIECEKWILKNTDEDVEIVKEFNNVTAKSLEITDADWELIKGRLVKPEKFLNGKKDFTIFEEYLAFNAWDRDEERFPKEFLKRLSDTIVGKRRLQSHDWSGKSGIVGRYFKSRLEKVSIDEAVKLMGNPNPGLKKELDTIEKEDGGIFYMVPTYYVPNEYEKEILAISAGLIPSSIGFRGAKFEEVKDDNDNTIGWKYILTSRTESVEGSGVGVEAQFGAETKKNLSGDTNISRSDYEGENGESRSNKEGEGIQHKNVNGGTMKIKSLEMEIEVKDLKELDKAGSDIDEKVQPILDNVKSLTDEVAKYKTEKEALDEVFGEGVNPENLKGLIDLAAELKSDLTNEVIRLQVLTKALPDEPERVETRKVAVEKWSIKEIKSALEDLQKQINVPADDQASSNTKETEKAINPRLYELS